MMKSITVLFTVLFVAACSQPAQNPKAITQQYWQAIIDGDTETAAALVSNESQPAFDDHLAEINAQHPNISQVALDDQQTHVITTINPDDNKPYQNRPFSTTLVLEDGEWRIDLSRTHTPAPYTNTEQKLNDLANEMSQSMESNIETMEEIMSEGMQLLNGILQQGSQEMGDAFLKGMEDMKGAMRESIENMKRRRQELDQAPETEQQDLQNQDSQNRDTQDDTGEGVI